MSYDINLIDLAGGVVQVARHEEGGTYALGGTTDASLNVTWNYAPYFYAHLDKERGIRWLYGKTGGECIERLESAIDAIKADEELEHQQLQSVEEGKAKAREKLKTISTNHLFYDIYRSATEGPRGYWLPTRENAVRPLRTLLSWAQQHPWAVFSGD